MKYLFKTIIRNFTHRPVINMINLLGLAISFTLVIILSVYCYSELTTDRYHKNGDRVYLYLPSADRIYTPGILKEDIDLKVPGVESAIRIVGTWEPPVFQTENGNPVTSRLLFADEDFFKFFSYNFIEGNAQSALKDPMTVVITKKLSEQLFGSEESVGKVIKLNNSKELTVCAVIEEPEKNSCLSLSAISSMATQKLVQGESGEFTEWGWSDFQTFLLLKNGINPADAGKTILNIIPDDLKKEYKEARLVPLNKVYFSKFALLGNDFLVTGDKKKVMILLMVAVMVLIIALVNFFNISSSQWFERIRQTGVLKIIGVGQSTILMNVLAEAFIFFLAALLIAADLVNIINPGIRNYTGIHYSSSLTSSPGFIITSLAGILVLSVFFSIIPAVRISSSKAIDNLKNTLEPVKSRFSFSGILVTMQFTIAIILIAFTVLVQKQVRFGSSNLGFNQKNIIVIKITPQLDPKKEVFKKLLLEKPAIKEISFSQFYPGKDMSYRTVQMDLNGDKKELNFDLFSADAVFFNMMGLKLVKGRLYSDTLSTDKLKVVVNETFLREHNLVNPLGIKFSMNNREYEIIGVVKDFHFKPVNKSITPLAIRNESYASYCLVNLQTASYKSLNTLIRDIKASASELSPSFPVEVNFLDQAIQNMYQSELEFRHTFSLFAGCAIVICCLGILAMSLFASHRRIKEIGIRKVNGARIAEILAMLNSGFVKWVGIAFVIASPIAWYSMHNWLQGFAYKTELSWWIFGLAGLIALCIALLTVSWQSWRAATRNPVEALRYE
jgi:putative ABC transport system permease protein